MPVGVTAGTKPFCIAVIELEWLIHPNLDGFTISSFKDKFLAKQPVTVTHATHSEVIAGIHLRGCTCCL
ncbi:Uncharacterised protein [Klebsiella quasivariicola]|nr:Uncharacterised protein [Klebsiella quasivariicola]